jgi:molybdenum cofactor cytidylyltransferase
MIGSRKKIRTLRQKFIEEGWATEEEFRRVHAPVGLEIGSVSVQEIALSIAAQLVQVRAAGQKGKKREYVSSLVLAAGESRRMGKPKMLLPYGDTSILETVVTNAGRSIIDHTSVVLGANSGQIEPLMRRIPVKTVMNHAFRNGMLSSVQAGLRALPRQTTAVLVLLGDQPMVSPGIIDRLIDHYKRSDRGIALVSHRGKRGHPLIFSSAYIPEVLGYEKDLSLRTLMENHPEEVDVLETGNPEILRDIDTEKDYSEELKRL